MQFKPSEFNRASEPGRIFFRCASIDVQERTIQLLDIDAAILHRLEGVGVLNQSARGLVGTGIGAVGGELHRTGTFSPRSIAAYFRAVHAR
jgi:hypothetical protein